MLTVYMHSLARALLLRKCACVYCTCELRTTVCVYSYCMCIQFARNYMHAACVVHKHVRICVSVAAANVLCVYYNSILLLRNFVRTFFAA